MEIMVWCFIGLAAGSDLIKKKIPGWLFWIFGSVGVVKCVAEALCKELSVLGKSAGSMAVGVGLLLLCGVTEGAVGKGDGWFFCVTGLYISWKYNLALLCYGLLLCSVYGMVLIIWGRWKGISVRKRKMPFLPFVCLAGILMKAGNM